MPHRPSHALLAAALLAAAPLPAWATPICRWVDDTGRTQLAQVAPDRYKDRAVCVDSSAYELSPEQQRAAQQRAQEDRARAERNAPAAPPGTTAPGASAPVPARKRPAEPVTDATDCATWWRLYDESVECFGPFRNTRGGTRPEAFDVCNVVASPVPKCGLRIR